MKRIPERHIYIGSAIELLAELSIIPVMMISKRYFIATALLGLAYALFDFLCLRCPNCKGWNSTLNLRYAIKHPYMCRNCGERITVQRREKRKDD